MRNLPQVVLALALTLPGIATARRGSSTETSRGSMASTGVDANARGKARLQVRSSSDGKLDVQVQRLDPNATYEILVDGVHVGSLATNPGGAGRARFRSRPRNSRDQLLGFDPRGAMIAVRNAAGQDVLAVMLADTSSTDDGDIICCLPDDSGTECEDRTPTECAAQGGVATTATSCLPNPCDGTTPPTGGDLVCCTPDDSGPHCEDRTAAECAAENGIIVTATSCDPNPCGPVTPPSGDDDIQCCLPDDSGTECEDRTPAECAVQGGVNAGPGTCTPNPCDTVNPPPTTGTVRVRCERRVDRSKVSVDGNGLAAGSYQARIVSGGNTATAGAQPTIGDEAEFDFDSDSGDIAEGATPIASTFIEGVPPQVTGAILTLSGATIAEATVTCEED